MRAIIISDNDARSLLDQLRLESMCKNHPIFRRDPDQPATTEEMHRVYHFIVTQWLQDMGATISRV